MPTLDSKIRPRGARRSSHTIHPCYDERYEATPI